MGAPRSVTNCSGRQQAFRLGIVVEGAVGGEGVKNRGSIIDNPGARGIVDGEIEDLATGGARFRNRSAEAVGSHFPVGSPREHC